MADYAPESKPDSPSDRDDRLDSWKEIAAYLDRDVRTAQRWEQQEGLPVHRHTHQRQATVYALRSGIDQWLAEHGSFSRKPSWSAHLFSLVNQRKGTLLGLAAGATVLILTSVGILVRDLSDPVPTEALDIQERSSVLITRFVNHTGEALFGEGTLEYALERELAKSPFVGKISRERVRDTLALMKKEVDTPIDLELGKEICLRDEKISAMVAGRVEKLGSSYLLKVELVDPSSGAVVASTEKQAQGGKQVLSAVSSLGEWVRESLGEQVHENYQTEEQLERVTTPSLRALHLYSKALEATHQGRWERVPALLQESLREDPDFATAHIMLAWQTRTGADNLEKFSHHLERAFELADNTNEAERFWILGSYYEMKGERDEAAKYFEALLTVDPNHLWTLSNLTTYWSEKGHRDEQHVSKVFRYAARRADLLPNNAGVQQGTAYWFAFWGNLSQAQKYVDRARDLVSSGAKIRPDAAAWIELFPAYRHWLQGNPEAALSEVDRVAQTLESRDGSEQKGFNHLVGMAYLSFGRLQAGAGLLSGPPATDWLNGWAAHAMAALAFAREDNEALRRALEKASALRSGISMPILLARLGPLSRAEEVKEEVTSRLRSSRLTAAKRKGDIKIMQGELARAKGVTSEAIDALEEGLASPCNRSVAYLGAESLAQIWLGQGEIEKALLVLETHSSRLEKVHAAFSSWEPAILFWMRLRLLLADVYRQTGQKREAQEVEAELSKLLSQADPDHPFLPLYAGRAKQDGLAAKTF